MKIVYASVMAAALSGTVFAQPAQPPAAPAGAVPPAATPAPAAPRYNAYNGVKKGQEALNKRDYRTAIKLFTEALDSKKLADSWIAPTLALRGRAYRLWRRRPEAIADLKAAVEKDPKLENAWYELALVYRDGDQFNDAIAAYSKTIELNPKNHLYWYGRCEARLFINKLKEAEGDCKASLEIKNDYVPALAALGRVYEDSKRKALALETYRRVLQLDPNNTAAKEGIRALTEG